MPYIKLNNHLPGVTGLLDYRKDSAQPIRNLTQCLMRGESTLTEAERELIAAVVSRSNKCLFCTNAHTAAADLLIGDQLTAEQVKQDIPSAPVSRKMRVLLTIAILTCKGGKSVTNGIVLKAKTAGATDMEIHDTILIASLFCLYNRYVDGLATALPPADAGYYEILAQRLVNQGYLQQPAAYAQLTPMNTTHVRQTA